MPVFLLRAMLRLLTQRSLKTIIDATNIFLDLAASLESQEKNLDKLANWLQANSNLISDR